MFIAWSRLARTQVHHLPSVCSSRGRFSSSGVRRGVRDYTGALGPWSDLYGAALYHCTGSYHWELSRCQLSSLPSHHLHLYKSDQGKVLAAWEVSSSNITITIQSYTGKYTLLYWTLRPIHCTMFFRSIGTLHSFRLKLCSVKYIVHSAKLQYCIHIMTRPGIYTQKNSLHL